MSLANHARGEQSKSGLNNSGSTQHNTSRKSCFHAKSTTKHTHTCGYYLLLIKALLHLNKLSEHVCVCGRKKL